MAISQRMTLQVLAACVVLLVSLSYTSRIARSSAATKALTQSETNTSATGCSKIMYRSLCKECPNYEIECLSGLSESDLSCISELCTKYKGSNVGTQCCGKITRLEKAMKGQTPDTLHISTDKFNKLANLAGGSVAPAQGSSKSKPKAEKWKPKPKVPTPEPKEVTSNMPKAKPWAAKLGWDLTPNGKFHYTANKPGAEKAHLSHVPTGCHDYAHVEHCFHPKHDSWTLGQTRNKKLEELQCIGYLCRANKNDKCCGTLMGILSAINDKNWMDLAEYEDHFDRLLRATGEYLE